MSKHFVVGQQIRCIRNYDYELTHGKVYTVLEYMPPEPAASSHGFSWPAYVKVMDDYDREVQCHAIRFIAVEQEIAE